MNYSETTAKLTDKELKELKSTLNASRIVAYIIAGIVTLMCIFGAILIHNMVGYIVAGLISGGAFAIVQMRKKKLRADIASGEKIIISGILQDKLSEYDMVNNDAGGETKTAEILGAADYYFFQLENRSILVGKFIADTVNKGDAIQLTMVEQSETVLSVKKIEAGV